MAAVSFRGLSKNYGAAHILKGIDLDITDGEFLVLIGPSGCGKSTTLRLLAGLEDITSGEIRIGDELVNNLRPRDRDIAMVFQDYALYPHKSVRDNLGFGLKVRGVPRDEAIRRIDEVAGMLGISHLLDRRPAQLSGGQRQRVAMGRAIVRRPQVFLFDEPLSNLDAQLRGQVRTEIKKLHQTLKTTTIYVTHDQVEAMTLADRIVILRDGMIEQIGTPDEIYQEPASTFVGRFIGAPSMNFLTARLESSVARLADRMVCDLTNVAGIGKATGDEIIMGLRPEHIRSGTGDGIDLAGTVQIVEPLGADTLVHLDMGKITIVARFEAKERPQIGQPLTMTIKPENIRLFDAGTERALR
ncbi:ABC transporter ATP-binding protein [Limoniibacter endophyticus]|uniref:ABC transporter permease n=1 Tax=Limoniibacter endophyticus TaxID=1565040 RepID=A0A8J3GHK1_9HYPH|nr:sn-glycerol-3-phosphate ABC transporter ATP-binding protein UgpC [Limoniibacter endophyticus]GHC72687.1 ABC transporter permease [Limoniibacter endophyticus]